MEGRSTAYDFPNLKQWLFEHYKTADNPLGVSGA